MGTEQRAGAMSDLLFEFIPRPLVKHSGLNDLSVYKAQVLGELGLNLVILSLDLKFTQKIYI